MPNVIIMAPGIEFLSASIVTGAFSRKKCMSVFYPALLIVFPFLVFVLVSIISVQSPSAIMALIGLMDRKLFWTLYCMAYIARSTLPPVYNYRHVVSHQRTKGRAVLAGMQADGLRQNRPVPNVQRFACIPHKYIMLCIRWGCFFSDLAYVFVKGMSRRKSPGTASSRTPVSRASWPRARPSWRRGIRPGAPSGASPRMRGRRACCGDQSPVTSPRRAAAGTGVVSRPRSRPGKRRGP